MDHADDGRARPVTPTLALRWPLMRRYSGLLLLTLAALACADIQDPVGVPPPHNPYFHVAINGQSVVKSAFGTPIVDGVFSPGEWSDAAAVNFAANLPAADGGGTTPATLYVLNDATNLYFAFRIQRPSLGTVNPSFEFDNEHLGGTTPAQGDDAFGAVISPFWPAEFIDVFRTQAAPCPVGFCGLGDVAFGGTSDGAVAGSNDGTFTYVELAHPLDDADNAHDFSLKPGDVVGFNLNLGLWSLNPFCAERPECAADTGLASSSFYDRSLFADLELAVLLVPVTIDVKPGEGSVAINLKSSGKTPVAILSGPAFDATTVNPATAQLADATVAQRPNGTLMAAPEDVNGDGRTDLVLHFVTSALQLANGWREVVLTAETVGGLKIRGSDWVLVRGGDYARE